ncbi:glutaredoxin 3 [Bdellovibrionota bacterium]
MEIKVYTTAYCGFCRRAKQLLKSKGIEFKEVDVTEDEEMRNELIELTGQRTVPQIFFDDQLIGGFQELQKLDQSGELDKRLKKD